MYFQTVQENDWNAVRRNFQKIGSNLFGPQAKPTFNSFTLTGLTTNSLIYPDSNKLLTSLGVASNGQLPIGSTAATPVLAGLTGTTNQITVTNGAGSITLSVPQNLHTGATDFEVAGLKVINKVTEFSTDGTLGGNSDLALPTEKAVKTYVDAEIASAKMTYKYIKATMQSEGDLHLSDGSNWAISKAIINTIRVVTSSTNWDLYLLQNDNGFAANDANIPKLMVANGINGNANLKIDVPYEDEDVSDEVHLYYLDNSGANTATIIVQGLELI